MPISALAELPANSVAEALEAAGDAAYVWDLDDDRIDWSGRLAAAGEALGAVLATGRAFVGRIHPDDLAPRQNSLALHLDGAGPFDCEYRLRTAEGGFAWLHERGRAERDAEGRVRRMFGVIRTVGDQQALHSRIERRASYDELTGHFNTSRLREAVDRIIAESQRGARAAAFLAVGVDGLAAVAANYGSEAADTILVEIGRRLDSCLRVNDEIGRLGGDRFGVILSHCPGEHVGATAGKVLARVHACPVGTARGPVAVTVSIGSTLFPDQGTTSYDVITRAETALAEARAAGCDGHVHYAADIADRDRQRFAAIADTVRRAVHEDRLVFAYQPVVSAETGAVDYHECLLHLRGADGQVMGAGTFIPAIERLGLIRLVDRHVLDRALGEIAAHPGVALGFNVSGLTAADRPWLRALTARLRQEPELARRIVIEITETAALYDIEESARFVAALRQAGCRVALDDFGAGHTSLRHLHNLPVDTVKIDGAFIRNLTESPENRVFLRHLIKLAAGFGFRTIAECVETADDAAILRAEGVDFLQGHHCGRPIFDPVWRRA
jgi:diguanylate cyclase (GGDEF)-like protein